MDSGWWWLGCQSVARPSVGVLPRPLPTERSAPCPGSGSRDDDDDDDRRGRDVDEVLVVTVMAVQRNVQRNEAERVQ